MSLLKFFKTGYVTFNTVMACRSEITAIIKEYRSALVDHDLSVDEAFSILNKVLQVIFKIYPDLNK